MSNERPDDARHWINKLGDPDPSAEPWEGKNAAWETLYSRLHEKPRRKIPVWYWAAAACLLLILCIPVRRAIRGSQTGTATGEPIVAKDPGTMKESGMAKIPGAANAPGTKGEPDGKGERTLTIRTQVALSRRPGTASATAARTTSPATTRTNTTITTLAATTAPGPAQLKVTELPAPDTMTIATLIVPPAKKKLRVVHINELSDPGEQNNLAMNPVSQPANQGVVAWTNTPVIQRPVGNNRVFTGNPRKHFLHFGRPKDQAEPWSTASTDNIRPDLIKIKLSPQN